MSIFSRVYLDHKDWWTLRLIDGKQQFIHCARWWLLLQKKFTQNLRRFIILDVIITKFLAWLFHIRLVLTVICSPCQHFENTSDRHSHNMLSENDIQVHTWPNYTYALMELLHVNLSEESVNGSLDSITLWVLTFTRSEVWCNI